jgi:hypothetical protein
VAPNFLTCGSSRYLRKATIATINAHQRSRLSYLAFICFRSCSRLIYLRERYRDCRRFGKTSRTAIHGRVLPHGVERTRPNTASPLPPASVGFLELQRPFGRGRQLPRRIQYVATCAFLNSESPACRLSGLWRRTE